MNINDRLAHKIKQLRDARGLTLEALSERSGVSRSTISLIERGASSPTATVLDKLATALGVVLATLFADPSIATGAGRDPSPLSRPADQSLWRDPGSGYVRRALSPPLPSPLQLVEIQFPAGQRVTYETGARAADVHQQIWMLEGRMDLSLGDENWQLQAGDCLAMRLNRPTVFHNPTTEPARYLVALVIQP